MIDWTIVAEPRDDGADIAVIQDLLDQAGFVKPKVNPGQTIFGVNTRVLDFTPKAQGMVSDLINDTYVAEVEALVGLWPAMDRQIRELISGVYPCTYNTGKHLHSFGGTYGTRDQNVAEHFGQIYATTDSLHGFTEGLVSSIGNWKLYAMGIKTMDWDNVLITSSKAQLVKTPTREEMKPVGVTLHAMYAILHVLEFNIRLAEVDDEYWIKNARFNIPRCATKIQRGLTTLSQVDTTGDGDKVFSGIITWANRLLKEAQPWL